ncbi:thiamine phosphate synthase [Candidatus Thiodiazotropha sp. CDECU1]|uniref:thiamine phosphate synthase n=1 Tax=Candidatus Thiodiazotropha sp. CDECU1 TaxID=3065865 RepID=UPI00292FF2B4|nr:thiamine phosphate synthase [Candidatus Thiodiazotropha sp. CDECU1]
MKPDKRSRLRGLYAITDTGLSPKQQLLQHVEQALLGGAAIIQYRDKRTSSSQRLAEATALQRLCRDHEALLIINDDVVLADQVGADGVHLGAEDDPLSSARNILGEDAIIGVSCYNRFDLARIAAASGADYIAFGRFFPSHIKPKAVQAQPGLLTRAKAELGLPLVAIGGITPENGAPLISAGADMLAVIHGVFGETDIQAASRKLSRLFEPEEKTR